MSLSGAWSTIFLVVAELDCYRSWQTRQCRVWPIRSGVKWSWLGTYFWRQWSWRACVNRPANPPTYRDWPQKAQPNFCPAIRRGRKPVGRPLHWYSTSRSWRAPGKRCQSTTVCQKWHSSTKKERKYMAKVWRIRCRSYVSKMVQLWHKTL